jgi:uncharacterized membrane protein YhaH (DUF805 family)
MDMIFCYGCGKQVHKTASSCPGCGALQQGAPALSSASAAGGVETSKNWYLEPLKKYATFSGRARRKEYWYFTLFSTLIAMSLAIIDFALGEMGILSDLYSLGVLLPSIALGVRRMHDTGRSGWWLLLPLVNLLFLCFDGDDGPNKYGEDPKYL